jgi:hypothetical protein
MTTPAYRGPGQPAVCASASTALAPSWLGNVLGLFSGVPTPAYVGPAQPAAAVPKAGWSRHNPTPTPAYAMPPSAAPPEATGEVPRDQEALEALARLIACQLDPALLATGQIAVVVVPLPTHR